MMEGRNPRRGGRSYDREPLRGITPSMLAFEIGLKAIA